MLLPELRRYSPSKPHPPPSSHTVRTPAYHASAPSPNVTILCRACLPPIGAPSHPLPSGGRGAYVQKFKSLEAAEGVGGLWRVLWCLLPIPRRLHLWHAVLRLLRRLLMLLLLGKVAIAHLQRQSKEKRWSDFFLSREGHWRGERSPAAPQDRLDLRIMSQVRVSVICQHDDDVVREARIICEWGLLWYKRK